MLKIKRLFLPISLVLLMMGDAFACQMKLNILNENQHSFLRESALRELEKKFYVPYESSEGPSLLMELKALKKNDYHNSQLKFPFVSLVVRSAVDNQMLNYVHGNGKSYKTAKQAYSEANFLVALNQALSHLPICN